MLGDITKRLLQGKTGRQLRAAEALGTQYDALANALDALRALPSARERDVARLGVALSNAARTLLIEPAAKEWVWSADTFLRLYSRLLAEGVGDPHLAKLVHHNAREAADRLPAMHAAFAAVFRDAPDYHGSAALDADEQRAHEELALLMEGWVADPIPVPEPQPLRTLRERAAAAERRRVERLRTALEPLVDSPLAVVPPVATRRDGVLRETTVGVHIADLLDPTQSLLTVADALQSVADVVDFTWVAVMRDGARVGRAAFRLNMADLREDGVLAKLARDEVPDALALATTAIMLSMPRDVPESAAALLPPVPVTSPAPPTLAALLVGLRAGVDAYVRRTRAVAGITVARDHPLTRELRRRNEDALASSAMVAELRRVAADLSRRVVDAPSSDGNASSYLHAFLDAVNRVLDRSELPEVGWADEWPAEALAAAGRRLEAPIA